VSPAAALSRFHRARRRLRALIDEAGNPAPGAASQLTGSPVRQHAKEV
jgi:hypothetical protein